MTPAFEILLEVAATLPSPALQAGKAKGGTAPSRGIA